MNDMIDFMCGVAMTLLVVTPVLYYVVWNLLMYLHKVFVEFVTDGDKSVFHNYVVPDMDKGPVRVLVYIYLLFILTLTLCVCMSLIFDDGYWVKMVLFPYNFGVFCSPIISLVLIGVATMFVMKYSYKLSKFTKQLKSHVADKEAHK